MTHKYPFTPHFVPIGQYKGIIGENRKSRINRGKKGKFNFFLNKLKKLINLHILTKFGKEICIIH